MSSAEQQLSPIVRRSPKERLAYLEGWAAGATAAALDRPEVFEAQALLMQREAADLRREIYG